MKVYVLVFWIKNLLFLSGLHSMGHRARQDTQRLPNSVSHPGQSSLGRSFFCEPHYIHLSVLHPIPVAKELILKMYYLFLPLKYGIAVLC